MTATTERKQTAVFFFSTVLALLLMVIAMTAPEIVDWIGRKENASRIEKIRSAAAKCGDTKACLGGFVVFRRLNPSIVRISVCDQKCGDFEMDVSQVGWLSKLMNNDDIIEIVLPGSKRWRSRAVDYAEQFIAKKQP